MANAIRIGIVGYGLIGKRHAEIVRRSPGMQLAAIVDPDLPEVTETPVFPNIEAMFQNTDLDGVVLATPTPLHVEQGLVCIRHKCPVLIEKPIAVTADDARRLNDAADLAKVPLLVGHHRRHNGMVQAAKQAIETGAVGDIRIVQATCWFYKPDYYFDVAPWRTKKGAGPISVNLVHDVDLLRHFCGEVKSVQAISTPSRRGFENEDLAAAILTFATGAIATLSVSDSVVAPWSWELTSRENPAYPATDESCYLIGGSEGGLSLPDLRVWQHEGALDWWQPMSAKSLTCGTTDPLQSQMDHFCRVIKNDEPPLVSGIEGMRSLEVVEAIAKSATTGNAIEIGARQTAA